MSTILATIVTLSVLTGFAASASAYDTQYVLQAQVFSTGQGR